MDGATPAPVRTERTGAILAPSWNTPSSGLRQPSQHYDEPVSIDFAAQNHTITEGQAANVTIRLSKQPLRSVTVNLSTTLGNNASTEDFDGVPPSVTFGPTETEQTFTVTVPQDTDIDGGETIAIGFEPLPVGVVAGNPATAEVTTIDASASPTRNVLDALRARVTGGAVFFNGRPTIAQDPGENAPRLESPQFAQASSYLAFTAQPRVWTSAWKLPSSIPNDGGGYPRVSREPLIDVRLTTIPVKGAGSSAVTNAGIQAPDASFLQSQKSAEVQLGAIVNRNFGGFGIGDARFHWALGGSLRGILQSVTDVQRTLRIWNIDDDLYDAWTAGLRLTLNQRSERSPIWMPTAYVDVSMGRFQNYEFVRECRITDGGECPGNENDWLLAENCLSAPFDCLTDPPREDAYFRDKSYVPTLRRVSLSLQYTSDSTSITVTGTTTCDSRRD